MICIGHNRIPHHIPGSSFCHRVTMSATYPALKLVAFFQLACLHRTGVIILINLVRAIYTRTLFMGDRCHCGSTSGVGEVKMYSSIARISIPTCLTSSIMFLSQHFLKSSSCVVFAFSTNGSNLSRSSLLIAISNSCSYAQHPS
jgi:hypothetical protein